MTSKHYDWDEVLAEREKIIAPVREKVVTPGFAGWGIRSGWYPLVRELHNSIMAICPDYEITLAKQKFCGLRFYVRWPVETPIEVQDEVCKLISVAEARSYLFCEVCGVDFGGRDGLVSFGLNRCPDCEGGDRR